MKRSNCIFKPDVLHHFQTGADIYGFGKRIWNPIRINVTGGKTEIEVVSKLKEHGVSDYGAGDYKGLWLLGLKSERRLEVYGMDGNEKAHLLKTFPLTGYSGSLGPKLLERDRQIPEGIYRVESLNPNSRFHLSVKIDYPNAFDRKMGNQDGRDKLGYDIFIHGKSATVGCIPIGDVAIEELFLMVSEKGKKNVTVILAPLDFRKDPERPPVDGIEWEESLYDRLQERMVF